MASLVANYGSSSDENDDLPDSSQPQRSNHEGSSAKNNFVASEDTDDYDTESGDEEEDDEFANGEQQNTEHERLPNPLLSDSSSEARLPPPSLGHIAGTPIARVENSVFTNPYLKREEAHINLLEKHVKLSDAPLPESSRGRRKRGNIKDNVCRKFLKTGSCHYGSKCKFSHNLESNNADPSQGGKEQSSQPSTFAFKKPRKNMEEPNDDDDDNFRAKKKRYGITNSLVPPKKALKLLEAQRNEERPWTMNY